MKSRVQQTELNCGGKQSFMEVSSLQSWGMWYESTMGQGATLLRQWHQAGQCQSQELSLRPESGVHGEGWPCAQSDSWWGFSWGSWDLQPTFCVDRARLRKIVTDPKMGTWGNSDPETQHKAQMCRGQETAVQTAVVTRTTVPAAAENR